MVGPMPAILGVRHRRTPFRVQFARGLPRTTTVEEREKGSEGFCEIAGSENRDQQSVDGSTLDRPRPAFASHGSQVETRQSMCTEPNRTS